MKTNIYAIKDHKFIFGEPFVSPDDSTAVRYFGFIVSGSQSKNIMNYAPADFDLFRVGTFDSETGQMDSEWPIVFIVNGASMIGDRE